MSRFIRQWIRVNRLVAHSKMTCSKASERVAIMTNHNSANVSSLYVNHISSVDRHGLAISIVVERR
jgi:hypothetical protein